MKKKLKCGMTIIMFCLFTITASAQGKKVYTAPWVSDLGYWVLETNINAPLHNIVRFYNNESMLVYTETLNGIKLNPEKRKVKMKLRKALETSIMVWQKTRRTATDKDYVKNLIR